jgi:hypothetical protein
VRREANLDFRFSIFDCRFADGPSIRKSKIENRKWLAPLALLAASSPAALAQPEPQDPAPYEATQRVLIDRTLSQRPARLVSISADTIEFTDAAGRVQTMPRTQVLALIPPLTQLDQAVILEVQALTGRMPAAERVRIYGCVDLVDGQALLGMLDAASQSAGADKPKPGAKVDKLAWSSKLFGPLTLPLDSIRTVLLSTEHTGLLVPGGAPAQDTVDLLNGDRVEGFVAGIDSSVHLEKSGKVTELPISRVGAVQLANPSKPAEGAWVWLHDGTSAAASQLLVNSAGHTTLVGRIAGLAKQPAAALDANDLRAICFDAGAIRALASCPGVVSSAGDLARRWTPPLKIADPHGTPLGAVDIELPGPMTVEWTLPLGAARVGTTLELPPSARVWGDCEVLVESVTGAKAAQLTKAHLNGSQPTAEVSVVVAGASKLRITIDAGPSGPIQDRVVLRRPVVMVEGKR